GTAEPQLRKECLSFWSVKAELGLRGPGREGSFFKIWDHDAAKSLRHPMRAATANGPPANGVPRF
ncbi:MAG: hypothetical protein WCK17_07785, partial [Verrucomicrobiota bacterium]